MSSYALDDGQRLLLIDPTTPPSAVGELALERETVIVLTCPWHGRDTRKLVERYGASVFTPPSDAPGSNAISSQAFAQVFGAGDRLPCGVEAFPEKIRDTLLQLLDLPIALVLPTDGVPTDRAALARALS